MGLGASRIHNTRPTISNGRTCDTDDGSHSGNAVSRHALHGHWQHRASNSPRLSTTLLDVYGSQ